MLKKRVLSALWIIPLLIAAVWFGEPWFTIFVAIWGLLAVFEFYKVTAVTKVLPLTYIGLVWTLFFILSPHFGYYFLMPLLLTSAVILSLICLLLLSQKEKAYTSWAWTMAGILYVGWLLSYFVALRGGYHPLLITETAGRDWVFFALFATFGSDTSAFFVGKTLGRHRLAPYISPGKTWEGAIAGVFGAIIVGIIFTIFMPISYGQAIFLGLLVSVFGQLGDLVESLLKRSMGIKDSSKIIPGHGGALDRIDSIVFAGVVVYYFVLAYNAGWLNWL